MDESCLLIPYNSLIPKRFGGRKGHVTHFLCASGRVQYMMEAQNLTAFADTSGKDDSLLSPQGRSSTRSLRLTWRLSHEGGTGR